jgi:GAF domain
MGTAPAKAPSPHKEVNPGSPAIAQSLPGAESVDRLALLETLRQAVANNRDDVESIFMAVAAAGQVLTGAGGIAVALRQNGRIVCRARSGEMAPELGATIDPDSGISGECVRASAILMCHDTLTDKRVDADVCRKLGVRSIVAVPLRGEMGMAGVFEAFSSRPNAFDSDALNSLRALSQIAETAYARERGEAWPPVPLSRKTTVRATQIVVDDVIGQEYSTKPSGRVWIIATVAMALVTFSVAWWSWHHSTDDVESATQTAHSATDIAAQSRKSPEMIVIPKPAPGMPLPNSERHLDRTQSKNLLRSAAHVQATQVPPVPTDRTGPVSGMAENTVSAQDSKGTD